MEVGWVIWHVDQAQSRKVARYSPKDDSSCSTWAWQTAPGAFYAAAGTMWSIYASRVYKD